MDLSALLVKVKEDTKIDISILEMLRTNMSEYERGKIAGIYEVIELLEHYLTKEA